ncbi:MAG: hypothetical protein IJ113_02715 [Eggerthellaceae bacterium]|nr:hypothetical protein [Eggerthellaceae bacterium]
MMTNPSTYEGKVVRMPGAYYHNRDDTTGNDHFFVLAFQRRDFCLQRSVLLDRVDELLGVLRYCYVCLPLSFRNQMGPRSF